MDAMNEIAQDFFPFVRVYKDGRIERFLGCDVVPVSIDPVTGVACKDVVIDAATGVSARLYLPRLADDSPYSRKLPILVYYHGGGFCIESPFSPVYHGYVKSLVAEANVVAVSVNYRLAPEHPLPAAYDHSWLALQWVASHARGGGAEPWLADHADFARVFMAGDSAGGNIVHNIALRAGKGGGVKIKGVVLIHPYFWGTQRMESEWAPAGERMLDPAMVDAMWRFVCPGTTGNDDPRINPLAPGAPSLKGLACERALVCVAEKDVLSSRGRAYYQQLKESGWGGRVELLETEGEDHVFHLFAPTCDKAQAMMHRLVAFFSDERQAA